MGPNKAVNVLPWSSAEQRIMSIKAHRGGIIPFFEGNKRLYCLGVDRKFGELTDFGGGISYIRDGGPLQGALREFHEETLGAFQNLLDIDQLPQCMCVFNRSMFIILVPLKRDVSLNDIERRFISLVSPETEISGLVWLDTRGLRSVIYGADRAIFNRVKKILYNSHVLNMITQ